MVVLSYHGLCMYVQSSCNPCEMTNMQSEMQSEMLLWFWPVEVSFGGFCEELQKCYLSLESGIFPCSDMCTILTIVKGTTVL